MPFLSVGCFPDKMERFLRFDVLRVGPFSLPYFCTVVILCSAYILLSCQAFPQQISQFFLKNFIYAPIRDVHHSRI